MRKEIKSFMKKYCIREFSILWFAKYILISAAVLGIFIAVLWGVQ